MRGLIIRAPWIDLILDGKKTWEMRSQRTNVRGPIALIRKGSNAVVGTADLVDSPEPLLRSNYMSHQDRHAIPEIQLDQVLDNGWVHPWVMTNVRRLSPIILFTPKSGPVRFLLLDRATSNAIADQVGPDAARLAHVAPRPAPSSTRTARPDQTPAKLSRATGPSAPSEMPIFTFRPEIAQAFGHPEANGSFVVLADSTAMRRGSPSVKRDLDDRDALVRNGVLAPDPDTRLYRFTKDHRFSSSSKAAGIIKDGNASGPSLWKDEGTGRTLRDHLAKV